MIRALDHRHLGLCCEEARPVGRLPAVTGSLAATVRGPHRQQPSNPAWVERPVILDASSPRHIAEIHSTDLASMELTALDRAQLNLKSSAATPKKHSGSGRPRQDRAWFELLRVSSAAALTAAQGLDACDRRVHDLHQAPLSS